MTSTIYLGILIALLIVVFLGDLKLIKSMNNKVKALIRKK